jgi:hypothetical protein
MSADDNRSGDSKTRSTMPRPSASATMPFLTMPTAMSQMARLACWRVTQLRMPICGRRSLARTMGPAMRWAKKPMKNAKRMKSRSTGISRL